MRYILLVLLSHAATTHPHSLPQTAEQIAPEIPTELRQAVCNHVKKKLHVIIDRYTHTDLARSNLMQVYTTAVAELEAHPTVFMERWCNPTTREFAVNQELITAITSSPTYQELTTTLLRLGSQIEAREATLRTNPASDCDRASLPGLRRAHQALSRELFRAAWYIIQNYTSQNYRLVMPPHFIPAQQYQPIEDLEVLDAFVQANQEIDPGSSKALCILAINVSGSYLAIRMNQGSFLFDE